MKIPGKIFSMIAYHSEIDSGLPEVFFLIFHDSQQFVMKSGG
jgi:hypothetical protein